MKRPTVVVMYSILLALLSLLPSSIPHAAH
jgi:hypothetical protein